MMKETSFSLLRTSLFKLNGFKSSQLELLEKELKVGTYADLLMYYPIRHQDRRVSDDISILSQAGAYFSCKGILEHIRIENKNKRKILRASFILPKIKIPLFWFNKVEVLHDYLHSGKTYFLFGKTSLYKGKLSIVHPELTPFENINMKEPSLKPIYRTTAKLAKVGLGTKGIEKVIKKILHEVKNNIPETLPSYILSKCNLISKEDALFGIHSPLDENHLDSSFYRIKFEELFFAQFRILQRSQLRSQKPSSYVCADTSLLRRFYEKHLPFSLTEAQKRVVKEIYIDLKSGTQMNRLLQGDVGSGKTIVAFLASLFPLASGKQVVIMAPTELLAHQIAETFSEHISPFDFEIALLTGSTPKKKRKALFKCLASGKIKMLVGTHALLEENVCFFQLALVIIDEQHRFGVAQRAKLWHKDKTLPPPHILVMTATPIPRTLAMTRYSHLETSILDQLPDGRKPVRTYHIKDAQRLRLFSFLTKKIEEGRQAYIVYPLIEESESLEYKYLLDGYESMCRAFPKVPIGILHGRMKSEDKNYEMQRFLKGETKIMVATTVIEVGVNVPNATVMVVESAENFGLAQLHQLRGRIKRSSFEGVCILVTADQISTKAYQRIQAMRQSDDGFSIAELDLKLRGGGNLLGQEQSGFFKLNLANISEDDDLVKITGALARKILKKDPYLQDPLHLPIAQELASIAEGKKDWTRVS